MNDITQFQGEYRWLSNFWPCPVNLSGIEFPSVENAYQAAKVPPPMRGKFRTCTAGESKRLCRTVGIRDDWEHVKEFVMLELLYQKFLFGSELGKRLAATDGVRLIEGNSWNDTYWGVCRGVGKNRLGELLMGVREYLLVN